MRVPRFSVLVSSLRSLGPGPCFIADGRWVLDQAPSFHVTGSILPLFVL